MHTSWTDGTASAREMQDRAVACGLKAILFSEHARKTSGDWFPRFASEIRSLPTEPCRALVGLEVKIEDFEGTLDTAPGILSETDMVIGSVHRFPDGRGGSLDFDRVPPPEAIELEFRLAMLLLDHPDVDILGHPFGMSYRRFRAKPDEGRFGAIIEKAAKTGVAIEINARYHPDPWRLIGWCQEAGARVSLGSDAHSPLEVGQIRAMLLGEKDPWNPSAS
jgi:histidinol phosphatase-like PHP family hydrolase